MSVELRTKSVMVDRLTWQSQGKSASLADKLLATARVLEEKKIMIHGVRVRS
jgi:hypothetical protein